MSERERANFLHAAVSRGPGKRQIKPSAAIFEGEAGALDDDEDDEDFAGSDMDGSEDRGESSEEESSSDVSDHDDDEDDEDEADEDDEDNAAELVKFGESAGGNGTLSNARKSSVICTICLNTKAYTKDVEVIQCDKCGVAVHETCYAVDDGTDAVSDTSSASTEPWFCEPCLIGLNIVPHCELCPSRTGAFKKANVMGSWVHLLCGLYTPGITFGDTDHLTAISWQEMDSRAFGRKACTACTNKLDARTGTTVQCEAGLCKNFYHVTCAQKLGLLIDNDTEEHRHHAEDGEAQLQQHSSEFCFILCKRHNHSEATQLKKEAYVQFQRQENARMATFNRTLLSLRQESKRQHQCRTFTDRLKRIEQFVTVTPSTVKRPRVLHNSSRFLNLFAEKAELFGIDGDRFASEFLTPPAEQIGIVTPAFSSTFFKYFENRERVVFPEEEERLQQVKRDKETALVQHQNIVTALKEAKESGPTAAVNDASPITLLNRFCAVLGGLNVPAKNYSQLCKSTKKHSLTKSTIGVTASESATKLATGAASPSKEAGKRPAIVPQAASGRGRGRGRAATTTKLAAKIISPNGEAKTVGRKPKATTITTTTAKRKPNSVSPSSPKRKKNDTSEFELPNDLLPSTSSISFLQATSGLFTKKVDRVEVNGTSPKSSLTKVVTVREQQQQNLLLLLGTISNSPVKGAVADAEEASTAMISKLKKSPSPVKRPNILSRSSNTKTLSSSVQ